KGAVLAPALDVLLSTDRVLPQRAVEFAALLLVQSKRIDRSDFGIDMPNGAQRNALQDVVDRGLRIFGMAGRSRFRSSGNGDRGNIATCRVSLDDDRNTQRWLSDAEQRGNLANAGLERERCARDLQVDRAGRLIDIEFAPFTDAGTLDDVNVPGNLLRCQF